jgi:predicted membrane-bound spermidine synthase
MKKLLKRFMLPFTVFVTGACVLVIEILATRMLAPYFGNTIFSFSSVISVVLAALSVGYWIGGRMADRYPSKKLFFGIIAASGVSVLCMQFMQEYLLPEVGYKLSLDTGPLIMSFVLFFLPAFILGTLSPFAIALQQRDAKHQGVGTTAGEMFFFSTLGSIAGSLLAGFVLIPLFGVKSIVIGVGVLLFLLGLIPMVYYGMERRLLAVISLFAGSMLILASVQATGGKVVYAHDGVYEKITVYDSTYNGRPTRFLMQDTSYSAAMYLDSDELVFDYSKYYILYEMFKSDVDRVLVMGGGAWSLPKAYLQTLPNAQVDSSEIEPSLIELSEKYFRLKDDPRMHNYIEDGRRMLHDSDKRYDVIFSDVYHSMYSVPAHFTTVEFMELVRDRLNPDGVFIANLIGSSEHKDKSFIWSEIRTMQKVFPQVYLFASRDPFAVGAQNLIAVGSMSKERLDMNDPRWRQSEHQVIREIAGHTIPIERMNLEKYPVLTDDYAPVDFFTASTLPKER